MGEHNSRFGHSNQLDIRHILLEAQHRWLRPAEICQILQNYKQFEIAPEPAHMPPSGSLFLFDRKVLRYFRKDGHNWRKKGDGKTVKEAHEKLKAGRVDVLHCYYAHGEQHKSFQRRTYWMLEEAFSHIVFVHYLDVKGNEINAHQLNETEGHPPFSETGNVGMNYDMESSLSSSFSWSNHRIHSQTMDTTCSNGIQVSEYEDVESAYNNQPISGPHNYAHQEEDGMQNPENGSSDVYYPVPVSHPSEYYGGQVSIIPEMGLLSLPPAATSPNGNGAEVAFRPGNHEDPTWENIMGNSKPRSQPLLPQSSFFTTGHDTSETMKEGGDTLGQLSRDSFGLQPELARSIQVQEKPQWSAEGKLLGDTLQFYGVVPQEEVKSSDPLISSEPSATTAQQNAENSELSKACSIVTQSYQVPLGRPNQTFAPRSRLSDVLAEEGLKKIDSFNRWMSKELGDDILLPQSMPWTYWDATTDGDTAFESSEPSQDQDNSFMPGPLISQEQLFSIVDFSPSWMYTGSAIEVLITGRFLKSQKEVEICKWSCMFGEVEVPAEVVADGVLHCRAPMHEAGRVPFYVTCSNRLACSEVREFEYCVNDSYDDVGSSDNRNTVDVLNMRFAKLICLDSPCPTDVDLPNLDEKSELSRSIYSLLNEDYSGWDDLLMLKQTLCEWLIRKAAEDGKGASVLDEGGQGVLHFASALGYDWALQPTVMAGVSIDFRDANGWTALHWAASCGREWTVASLISLGASPGALTDPSPVHPSGRTPADLASDNGHKGIAGFLAESQLSVHLSLLNLDSNKGQMVDKSGITATPLERNSTLLRYGESPSHLSLKDSLSAVCNATLAAAHIHQAFRVKSFQRKQLRDLGDDKFGMSDERALSLIVSKTYIPGKGDNPLHAAATHIQNKFRGWKGRKEFLITRKKIVMIQAHFRGHQVRKNYKKIIWSVWILEKVILRWRRKRNGLRNFAPKDVAEASKTQDATTSEDDDDFLRKGRQQAEERTHKALARVKSMAQYPEARDQYSRLSNVVSKMRLSKEKYASSSNGVDESPGFGDDLIDIEQLLNDDI